MPVLTPVYQYSTLTAAEQARMASDVISADQAGAIGTGHRAELERAVAARIGRTAAIAVDSGSAALALAVRGLGIGASASYLSPGPERWHSAPEPFHATDAGPLADMGPYYLASLVYLLGRIEDVINAVTSIRPLRTITTGPRAGRTFTASAPTHVIAVLRTETGIPITFTTSFDTAGTRAPHLEIHGSKATMVLPDRTSTPATFSYARHTSVTGSSYHQPSPP